MISVDTKSAQKYERDLMRIRAKAIPYAIRATQNGLAFKGQKLAREEVREKMITRNKFTEQSIQVDKARAGQNYSVLGSTAPYMEKQEFGGMTSDPTITTQYAAGEGRTSQPRKRLARKPNRMANIRLKRKAVRAKSRKQRNLVKIIDAVRSGNRFVFLDLGKRSGIFRVVGGNKRNPGKAKLQMVQRTDITAAPVPRQPWLAPAVARLAPHAPGIYEQALRYQLARHARL